MLLCIAPLSCWKYSLLCVLNKGNFQEINSLLPVSIPFITLRNCIHVHTLHVYVEMIMNLSMFFQLQELICQILQGHLVMFRKDSFLSILSECIGLCLGCFIYWLCALYPNFYTLVRDLSIITCDTLVVTDGSLEWETLEQYFLWQLISAHNIPVDYIMPVLPKLDYSGE